MILLNEEQSLEHGPLAPLYPSQSMDTDYSHND